MNAKARRLQARLTQIEEDYDAGYIDGPRFKVAEEKVKTELAEAQRAQARLHTGRAAASTLSAADPVAAFDNAPLMIRRNVVDALCTVAIAPAARGRKAFDPESVTIEWKAGGA